MSAVANLGKQDPIKLAFGAVIVIAVLYYLARKTLTDGAAAIGNGLGNVAASVWSAANPAPYVTAKVKLPNGSMIDPSKGEFLSVGNNTAQWRYAGTTYTLGARDAAGIYPASMSYLDKP